MMSQKTMSESKINETFQNKSVLITGATGLVGKSLVYKLLISVQSLHKIYVLIRSKRGKSVSERFKLITEKSYGMFDKVNEEMLKKLVPIEGDITSVGLGLSQTDRDLIINNVSIVFHSAADVTFDKDIKKHLICNVGGTKEMIDLCRQLKRLDVFVYVSTTYSNPLEMVTEEKVYKQKVNAMEMLEIARKSENQLDATQIIGQFPNTYTFTKNLAESLVKSEFEKGGLIVTIVRPGIVSPAYREPYCGYFGSITSLAGGFIMIGAGLGCVGKASLDITADAIPVDIVANTCIAAADYTINKNQTELRVYNCNTACLGAPKVNISYKHGLKYFEEFPIKNCVRPPNIYVPQNMIFPLFVVRFFYETCFAYFLDFVLLLIGRKRFVVGFMNKFQNLADACECFISYQWYFTNNNQIELSQGLIGSDKNTFDCDIRSINWLNYGKNTYFTGRKIILKETDEDILIARKRYKLLKTGYIIMNHFFLYFMLKLFLSITRTDFLISSYTTLLGFHFIGDNLSQIIVYLLTGSAIIKIIAIFTMRLNFEKYV